MLAGKCAAIKPKRVVLPIILKKFLLLFSDFIINSQITDDTLHNYRARYLLFRDKIIVRVDFYDNLSMQSL